MNDLEHATLQKLVNAGMPNPSKWSPPDETTLGHHQEWVNEKRVWAKSITDRSIRNAYLKWIDCTQRQIDQCREENRTHAERKKDATFRKNMAEEDERVRELAETLPTPPR